jgi:phytanoyl-CoA hydroxylase
MERTTPRNRPAGPPTFRSRYGGLWTDRSDAHAILRDRQIRGLVSDAEAESISHYIDHGYVVFPRAVDAALVEEYLVLFEQIWKDPPSSVHARHGGKVLPLTPDLYDQVAKIDGVHHYFSRAGELIFPPPVLRFLTQIYDRPPVAFQTMTMRLGSEEPLHTDTGPLTLTEPMSLTASWLALEDIQPSSGELQFIPGSHLVPELLVHGVNKAHHGDLDEYGRILKEIRAMCDERGLKTENFMAKAGDVLIWHADLMHGGAVIEDRHRTRKSMVAHFMPLGVMPTFYNASRMAAFSYEEGGHCITGTAPGGTQSPRGWRRYVGPGVRSFVGKRVATASRSQ